MPARYSVDILGREFIIEKYSDESGNVQYYVKSFNGVKSENFFMKRSPINNDWHIAPDHLVPKDIQNIEGELARVVARLCAMQEN